MFDETVTVPAVQNVRVGRTWDLGTFVWESWWDNKDMLKAIIRTLDPNGFLGVESMDNHSRACKKEARSAKIVAVAVGTITTVHDLFGDVIPKESQLAKKNCIRWYSHELGGNELFSPSVKHAVEVALDAKNIDERGNLSLQLVPDTIELLLGELRVGRVRSQSSHCGKRCLGLGSVVLKEKERVNTGVLLCEQEWCEQECSDV